MKSSDVDGITVNIERSGRYATEEARRFQELCAKIIRRRTKRNSLKRCGTERDL
jgi:hypothetical protein